SIARRSASRWAPPPAPARAPSRPTTRTPPRWPSKPRARRHRPLSACGPTRAPLDGRPDALYFATAAPAYLDKTNAAAIHAALALDTRAPAFDMVGSVRSGAGALWAAIDAGRPTLRAV